MTKIHPSLDTTLRAAFLALLLSHGGAAPASPRQSGGGPTAPATTATAPRDQATDSAAIDARAEQIVLRAIEAQGGRAYLDIRSIVSRGIYTSFQDGATGLPRSFTDYLVYPDRERTEFRGQGIRTIQTYVGDKGWIYDGATRTISDVKPAQAKDFQIAMRTSPDNLLRGWWRGEGAQLSYVGRREAGLAKRNEVVRLTYPDGFSVEFEIGAKDALPAKTIFKRQNADGEEIAHEDRFAQYLKIEGVIVPFVIDNFRAGIQTGRINYQTIELNAHVPDALFARPADVKALK